MAERTITAGRIDVELTHADKVFYPGDGTTKGDVVEYYAAVAGQMLPWLADRPLIMARYPDGIDGPRIVQKNVPSYFPDWIHRVTVPKQGGTVHHVVADQAATLVYLANQACIEPHIFLSRTGSLDRPDQFVLDLDPEQASEFGVARRCALWLRDLLADDFGVTSFVRTTGGKGLHVHVPLDGASGFDAVREFVTGLAHLLAAQHPDELTTEQRKEHRGGRLYLDVMRNAYAQSVVAPYAVRARPGAGAATLLSWAEVEDESLTPGAFTLRTVPGRLAHGDGPWAGMFRHRYGLARLQEKLARLQAG